MNKNLEAYKTSQNLKNLDKNPHEIVKFLMEHLISCLENIITDLRNDKIESKYIDLKVKAEKRSRNLSKSLTQIIDGFDGKPALFKGDLNIKSGLIQTDNLNVKNQNNRIDIKGSYDMIADLFDVKILFFESDNLVVEALVLGNIENPSIQIVNENIISNNKDENVDLKKVFVSSQFLKFK